MTACHILILSILAGTALPAWACEPPAVYHDRLTPKAQFDQQEAINAFVTSTPPVVGQIYLSRGTDAQESLCGGQGYVEIELIIPPNAGFDFSQVGFELRLIEGNFPQTALPQGPVMSLEGPETMFAIDGSWFEGPPRKHKAINAVMEVRFVSPDGTTGPGTQFNLVSVPEKPKSGQGATR